MAEEKKDGKDVPNINREETQGDWASGDAQEGSSMSVGEAGDGGLPPEQTVQASGGSLLDRAYLESLVDDVDFPADQSTLLDAVRGAGERGRDHGVDVAALAASMPQARFETLNEWVIGVHNALDRKIRMP